MFRFRPKLSVFVRGKKKICGLDCKSQRHFSHGRTRTRADRAYKLRIKASIV